MEVSLHLKLPGDLALERAHEIAEEVEAAILAAVPEVEERADAPRADSPRRPRGRRSRIDTAAIERGSAEEIGAPPRGAPIRPDRRGDSRLPHARARQRRARLRTLTVARARSRRACARPFQRLPTSWYTLSRRARLCMFHPVGHPMERGWVGGSTATASSTSPPRRCSRSSRVEARLVSTPSISSPRCGSSRRCFTHRRSGCSKTATSSRLSIPPRSSARAR